MLSKHISNGVLNFLIPKPFVYKLKQLPVMSRCFLLIT
jgi:hypothetical protein